MNELVSVIITTYNRDIQVFKRAVESVRQQTYSNIELIIVNDCPENYELDIQINKYITSLKDLSIKYIVHKVNMGACKARNTGLTQANGKYIAFLDDDDEWMNNKIQSQIKLFDNTKIGAVYCFYNNIRLNSRIDKVIPCSESGNLFKQLLRGNCIGGTSMPLIKKSVFDTIGVFDEELASSQDHDMWLRISERYEFRCCNQYLVNRYMQSESITMNIEKQKSGFERFLDKNSFYYKENLQAYNYILNQKAKQWISLGYFRNGFELNRRATKALFFSFYNLLEPTKGIIKYLFRNYKEK